MNPSTGRLPRSLQDYQPCIGPDFVDIELRRIIAVSTQQKAWTWSDRFCPVSRFAGWGGSPTVWIVYGRLDAGSKRALARDTNAGILRRISWEYGNRTGFPDRLSEKTVALKHPRGTEAYCISASQRVPSRLSRRDNARRFDKPKSSYLLKHPGRSHQAGIRLTPSDSLGHVWPESP